MTKTELVANVAEMYDYPKNQVKEVVDGVLETIQDALADGGNVQIPGFGTFSTTHIAEREGRNPSNGEAMTVAAHNRVKFKPGKGFKEAVN